MKTQIIALVVVAVLGMSFRSDKPAYRIFNSEGKEVKFEKMMKDLAEADVVCFGERHNDPIIHWLQYEVTADLFGVKQQDLVLGAEMYESDNQLIMDEYFTGLISDTKFEAEARLWDNYKTDYKPVLEFARENDLRFVATNIPRRYASLVYSSGFEGLEELSDQAKAYIAPLPVDYDPELPGYKSMLKMSAMGGGHGGTNENLPRSQAIKDATMAHFILQNWSSGKLFIHFNGSYHSDNFEGIVWYLKNSNPDLNIKTITAEYQDALDSLNEETAGKADYIVVIPESMTKTY
jgi:uncharacterized iron-regulated protein